MRSFVYSLIVMRLRYFYLRTVTVALVAFALVGCGTTPELPPASVVSAPRSTATTPTDSTPESVSVTLSQRTSLVSVSSGATGDSAGSSAEWVDVTGNLVGIKSECGNVSIVASSPSAATEVVVIALHGAFAMDDHSGIWTPLGTGVGSATITNRGMTIIFDPTDHNTFWEVGAYNGGGVYRTVDAGQTFHQLGALTHIDALSIDFKDPLRQTMIAAVHESSQLYRSNDGGATWTEISLALPPTVGYLSGPVLLSPNSYLVGSRNDTGSGVFMTTTGGATWTKVYQGGVTGYPVVPASDGVMYWARENGGIIASADDAATWTTVADGTVTSAVPINLVGLADGRIATLGVTNRILASPDRGQTWSFVGPKLPFSPNGISYSKTENALYAWRLDCNFAGTNVVTAQSIVRLDLGGS